MLTTFETIAMIAAMVIAVVLYFLPTITSIRRCVLYVFFWNKVISSKKMLVWNIVSIILLSIIFVFVWPDKVMLFPVKVGIYVLMLTILHLITQVGTQKSVTGDLTKMVIGVLVSLFILGIIPSFYGVNQEPKYLETDIKTSQYQIVELNEYEVTYYDSVDSEEKTLSISEEDDIEVKSISSEEEPYLEVITTTYQTYFKYNKEKKIIPIVEKEYIIYIPESQQ